MQRTSAYPMLDMDAARAACETLAQQVLAAGAHPATAATNTSLLHDSAASVRTRPAPCGAAHVPSVRKLLSLRHYA
ncbi:hypothetical protein EON68_02910 [archaeon]|nr:MAG: hypothetical protein EON68_02910 [archaeon]